MIYDGLETVSFLTDGARDRRKAKVLLERNNVGLNFETDAVRQSFDTVFSSHYELPMQ